MDRATWNNLPVESRPFPDRLNVIIASSPQDATTPSSGKAADPLPKDVLVFSSLEEALEALGDRDDLDDLFLLGGAELFAEAIVHPDLEEIELIRIEENYECDSFFPDQIPEDFQVVSTSDIMESDALEYSIVILAKSEADEEEKSDEDEEIISLETN